MLQKPAWLEVTAAAGSLLAGGGIWSSTEGAVSIQSAKFLIIRCINIEVFLLLPALFCLVLARSLFCCNPHKRIDLQCLHLLELLPWQEDGSLLKPGLKTNTNFVVNDSQRLNSLKVIYFHSCSVHRLTCFPGQGSTIAFKNKKQNASYDEDNTRPHKSLNISVGG